MIREATLADVDGIARMVVSLLGQPPFNEHWPANEACVRGFVVNMIGGETTAVFVLDQDGIVVGMIGAATFRHQLSGLFMGQELGWWVDPQARGQRSALALLKRAEQWAIDRGVVAFQVQAPTKRVGDFYEALGYGLCELSYQKRVA